MPKQKNKITIVMAYYENGGMLDRHLFEWQTYSDEVKDRFKAVIVDDGSSKDPAFNHLDQNALPISISLFRILKDIPWNQNGARNLGMSVSDGWCLITDMDHLLTADQAAILCRKKLRADCFYVPLRRRAITMEPYKRHPNSYLLTKELYWLAGGYDESYAGYYGTDSTLRRRLAGKGKRIESDDWALTLFGREVIPDASTTAYGRKDSPYHISNNPELNARKALNPKPIPPLNFPWERVF